MLNTMVLVGTLIEMPEIKETSLGNKLCTLKLSVPRCFPNSNGEYEVDIFPVTLWRGIAESTAEHCRVGAVLGIKGRMQGRELQNKEGHTYPVLELVAEKVTFITP